MKRLALLLFLSCTSYIGYSQVKISGMPETTDDPTGGWVPVVLNGQNYKFNAGTYLQERSIASIRTLSPGTLPDDFAYYVTDQDKQGFFKYDKNDATSIDDGALVLVTLNNKRLKRIVENNRLNIKWFMIGTNPGALISQLGLTYAQAQAIFNTAQSRVKLLQNDFDTQNATWFAIQRAINYAVNSPNGKVYIPAGQYNIGKGILIAPPIGGFISGLEIEGAAIAYNGGPSQTSIFVTNGQTFGFGFQRCKGVRVKNLFLTGNNSIGLSNSYYDIVENPNMNWVVNGCRNVAFSPHAGLIVDPLATSGNIADTDRYPGFETFYIDPNDFTGKGGSTDVIFDNCKIWQFVVGIAFSPHGYPQNGDAMAVNNSWVDYCKSAISIGQSQNRSIYVNNLKCWGATETVFDSENYGNGNSDLVEVDGLNVAGGVRYLCRLGYWGGTKGLTIRRMHAETLYSLGGGPNGNGKLIIDDSWVDLTGEDPGSSIHAARSAFYGNNLSVKNSFFGQYQGANALPVTITALQARFENCQLYGGMVNVDSDTQGSFTDLVSCNLKLRGNNSSELSPANQLVFLEGDEWQMNRYGATTPYRRVAIKTSPIIALPIYDKSIQHKITFGLSQLVQLTSINSSLMTADFVLSPSSSDFSLIKVGDPLYSNDNVLNEFGHKSTFLLGRVASKDIATGKVSLELTAKGINTSTSYYISITRPPILITDFIVGTTAAGSNVITNIVNESFYFLDWSGYTIQSPFFPRGTYIVSTNAAAKTFTMSNKAISSFKGAEIIGADWNAVEYGPGPSVLSNSYGYQAYKKGDIVYNTDLVNFPDIEKWVCVKSGFLGSPSSSAYPAEFTIYFKNSSNSFTFATTTTTSATFDAAAGRLVSSIIIRPTVALSGFKIGTTAGGGDVVANTTASAGTDKVIVVNRYFRSKTTLHVTFTHVANSNGSAEIIIPK
jgi:hypothetical protein